MTDNIYGIRMYNISHLKLYRGMYCIYRFQAIVNQKHYRIVHDIFTVLTKQDENLRSLSVCLLLKHHKLIQYNTFLVTPTLILWNQPLTPHFPSLFTPPFTPTLPSSSDNTKYVDIFLTQEIPYSMHTLTVYFQRRFCPDVLVRQR